MCLCLGSHCPVIITDKQNHWSVLLKHNVVSNIQGNTFVLCICFITAWIGVDYLAEP